jgi:N-acetylmuramoyl-L-alanine amidase
MSLFNFIQYIRFVKLYFLAIILLLNLFSYPLNASDENGKLKVLVIDPGHGGQDPGALGSKAREKDIVLAIGLKLGMLINENHTDVKVIFTRKDDTFIPLHERAEIANRNNADLFISIHANANKNHTIFGAETYAMGLHTNEKNMEVAKKENAAITFEKDYSTHYEGYDPNSAESFIIFTLMQNTFMEQSLEFANFIQTSFDGYAQRINRGVKQAGFLVLWKTSMPSVLIETGFISNSEEEKYLTSEEGQNKLAESIYKSFLDYKTQIESKSNFTQTQTVELPENTQTIVYDTSAIAANTDIIFKVQILSSQKQIKDKQKIVKKCKKIKGFSQIDEFYTGNSYKYSLGSSNNYKEIIEFTKAVKKVYAKAFIIAFKNGKIIPLNDALKR